ncbi:hypothetical protein [Streptomyces umbrinus]|uniref:hypothetical protein n=1 Tax=Streptomyces umbrinus TaxID=67370 RepID=UPI0033E5E5C4
MAHSLPEPVGARVLACILQLTEREDAARFWWQYAAGAGEHAEAQWWHAQAHLPPAHSKEEAGQHEFSAALRVLRGLQTDDETQDLITRTARVSAVLAYVPAAVAYVDDTLDLLLPDPDFADRIASLTTTPAPTPAPVLVPKWHTSLPGPPARRRAPSPATAGRSTAAKTTSAWQWNDSGGAFGHAQRTADFTAARRCEQAWHAFWQHCENCAACDPAGSPCPAYGTLW